MSNPPFTWMNGRITPWEDTVIHVNTDAVLRGANVFEGVRAYVSTDKSDLLVFRLPDHLKRLYGTSMRVLRLSLPYSESDIEAAVLETLRANELREDTHIRIVAYFGEGKPASFLPEDISTGCFILTIPRTSNPAVDRGIRACVSTWRRIADSSMPPRVKAGANYLNSRLATVDARLKGFDMPIFLNERGKVAEGPGQCIFVVRSGTVITPRTTDSILEGLTRDTLLGIINEWDLPCEVREVDSSELYIADEMFFAGTAAEVLPIVEVDHYPVGDVRVGPITSRLQTAYGELVRGARPSPSGWLTSVYRHVIA
jgi:branched-chain amino acid aminotransferase